MLETVLLLYDFIARPTTTTVVVIFLCKFSFMIVRAAISVFSALVIFHERSGENLLEMKKS